VSDPTAAPAIHGILVTYHRPESLAAMVEQLADIGLATLTVVDNGPSPESKEAAHTAAARVPTTYIEMDENSGPAGGYERGMGSVLETAADEDGMLVLDDDRLTGSAETAERLRDFAAGLVAGGERLGAVGQMGARFDRRWGRLHRLRDEVLVGAVKVDYIAGGQMLMIRVAAARDVGVFDARLFFAFDDLDYCLRLARAGYSIYVHGPSGVEARERFGRLGTVGRVERRGSPWRRYYSVRNHIVVMRRYTSLPAAVFVTLAHLVGRPVLELTRRQPGRIALIKASTRGCVDAWLGRLGRRMDPGPSGDQRPRP
jgi:hypothetical protein